MDRENVISILLYNVVAFLSLLIPIVIGVFIAPVLGLLIGVYLWIIPGSNYGCIHLFFGGWQPFLISYPLGMYLILETTVIK